MKALIEHGGASIFEPHPCICDINIFKSGVTDIEYYISFGWIHEAQSTDNCLSYWSIRVHRQYVTRLKIKYVDETNSVTSVAEFACHEWYSHVVSNIHAAVRAVHPFIKPKTCEPVVPWESRTKWKSCFSKPWEPQSCRREWYPDCSVMIQQRFSHTPYWMVSYPEGGNIRDHIIKIQIHIT